MINTVDRFKFKCEVPLCNDQVLFFKPWLNGPASSRKWTQVELAQSLESRVSS